MYGTVEPLFTDTCLIQTPVYNEQFCLSRQKSHLFNLKLTHLIQMLVNMHLQDNINKLVVSGEWRLQTRALNMVESIKPKLTVILKKLNMLKYNS